MTSSAHPGGGGQAARQSGGPGHRPWDWPETEETGQSRAVIRSEHNNQPGDSRDMADSEMSPKAKVTYDQNKFEVDLNVSEYLPEVMRLSVISKVFLDFI